MTRRIINIRVTFVVFIGLMLGILFCRALCLKQLSNVATIFIIMLLLLFCGSVILYAMLTRKRNALCPARKDVSAILIVSSIGFCIAFLVGIFIILFPLFKIVTIKNYTQDVTVYGTVCDFVENDETYTKFLIDDVIIDDGECLNNCDFKICVYTTKSTSIDLGECIEFISNLSKYKITKSEDCYNLYQNIAYSCYINFSDIQVFAGKQVLKDKIKNSTKEILADNLNGDNASIFFAVLFGDKAGLNEDITDMFSYAGISHILAVSGLHISFIVSLLYFIMKKCKVNKYVRLSILSAILIFYSYLCSFTPSVCRASIMAILLCLCDIFQIEYDSLSSLSIAGIIILLASPQMLFQVSFQLSFLCIFSIITLAPSINDFFVKIKCPELLATSLAMSVATNVAILPVCLNVFTKVSLLGVISNIFILPIFSVAYVLLFVITVFCLIFKFLGFLLFIPNLFLHIIKVFANYISNIPFGIFNAFNISYWSLVLLMGSAITLQFLLTRKLIKGAISGTLACMVLVIFILSSFPKTYNGNNFIFLSKYNSNACYYVNDGEVTLIGSSARTYTIDRELKRVRLKKITNIIAYDLNLNKLDDFLDLCKNYNVDNVYLPKTLEYDEIKNKFNNAIFFEDNLQIGSLDFSAIYYNSQITAVYLNGGEFNRILIPELKPTQDEGKYISDYCENLDIDVVYLHDNIDNLDLDKINPLIQIINNDCIYYKNGNSLEFDMYIYN